MRVLITSGGTTERIDAVRGISNFATGTLGKITAETFLRAGHQVVLLAGDQAVLPAVAPNLEIVKITDTEDLLTQMKAYVARVDVVIHSMAVSDYRPVYMTGLENFPSALTKDEFLNFQGENAKKISSKSNFQVMLLQKTPKIIAMIKKWNPQVMLFGFKLLAGVSEEELLKVARKSLQDNQADFIVANDLENIDKTQHKAFLVSDDRKILLQTKLEIAQEILKKAQEVKHG